MEMARIGLKDLSAQGRGLVEKPFLQEREGFLSLLGQNLRRVQGRDARATPERAHRREILYRLRKAVMTVAFHFGQLG